MRVHGVDPTIDDLQIARPTTARDAAGRRRILRRDIERNGRKNEHRDSPAHDPHVIPPDTAGISLSPATRGCTAVDVRVILLACAN
jgi:hypothetical protein